MKVLVFGAGVIGTTYGWQFQKIGCDVTHFVRKEKHINFKENGISIKCFDKRKRVKKQVNEIYRPHFISDYNKVDNYDLILLSLKSHQLISILKKFKDKIKKANVLIFQNTWHDVDEIENFLDSNSFFYGFPFKVGGRRVGDLVETTIIENQFSCTVLGEKNGEKTGRLSAIYSVLKKSNMQPKVSKNITAWLWSHYVWAIVNLSGLIKAGCYKNFITSSKHIKKMYLAMREGFNVCEARGANPKEIGINKLFYFPLFFLVPFSKIINNNEDMKMMLEGHARGNDKEIKYMYYDVLDFAKKENIPIENFISYKKYVDNFDFK